MILEFRDWKIVYEISSWRCWDSDMNAYIFSYFYAFFVQHMFEFKMYGISMRTVETFFLFRIKMLEN